MIDRYRRIGAAAIACVLLLSAPAHAGLKEALDSMFLSNVTSAGVYASQTRGGFVGGSAAFRAPIRNVNLLTFDPPRLDLGCGGIDFFGGSFSFINADQLVALFRQIAANAVGVLFKRAINAISPDLGNLMTEFQNKLQALNQAMKNTCALANMVVNSVADPSAAANQAQEVAGKVTSAVGSAKDLFDGIFSLFSKPSKGMKEAQQNNQCSTCGNLVWKALSDNSAASAFMASEGDEVGGREIIMSLVGTVIISNDGNEDVEPTSVEVFPTLTLRSFRYGSSVDGASNNPFKVLRCQDGTERYQCMVVADKAVTFDGAEGYVRSMLFGAADASAAESGSIISKIRDCSAGTSTGVCGFTSRQMDFIGTTPAPLLALFRELQHTPEAMDSLAAGLIGPIADMVALHYGRAAIGAASQAYSQAKVKKPDNVNQVISDLRAELISMEDANRDSLRRILEAKSMVVETAKANPMFFLDAKRRAR